MPYDKSYEPLFVTLVGTLICLGQKPRCVLEIRETGRGRLTRIYELLETCPVSIHDLSRASVPPRFNMPFELGLAASLLLRGREHEIVVFDRSPYRLDRHLSDYRGRDALIHGNSCSGMITCVLDAFSSAPPFPEPQELRRFGRTLREATAELRQDYGVKSIFASSSAFVALVSTAADLAVRDGLISA